MTGIGSRSTFWRPVGGRWAELFALVFMRDLGSSSVAANIKKPRMRSYQTACSMLLGARDTLLTQASDDLGLYPLALPSEYGFSRGFARGDRPAPRLHKFRGPEAWTCGRFIKFTIELTGPDPRCKLSGPPVTAVFASRPDPQGSRVNHPPNL